MRGKILAVVIVIVIASVLTFAYVVPYGISRNTPSAMLQLYVQDSSTGETFIAELELGNPENTMAVTHPSSPFKPLEAYASSQAISVYKNTTYEMWASVSFTYTGDRIATYDSISASFQAKKVVSASQTMVLLNPTMWAQLPNVGLTEDNTKVVVPGTIGVPGGSLTLSMSPTDAWVHKGVMGQYGNYLTDPLKGLNLNGMHVYCWVTATGTANDGTMVTATVTGDLTITATWLPEGGTLSIKINDMSSGLS